MIIARLEELSQKRPKSFLLFIYGALTSIGLHTALVVRFPTGASGRSIRLFGTAGQTSFEMLETEAYCYDCLANYHDEDWPAIICNLIQNAGLYYAAFQRDSQLQ